jgi:hypothetical protein
MSGSITDNGAVIDVFVGVGRARRAFLERRHFLIPPKIRLRAQLDTGSAVTGFTPAVFAQLGTPRIDVVPIRTPSTTPGSPHYAPMYEVTLSLVSGIDLTDLTVYAVACADFDRDPEGDVHGIIGRDVLDRCTLFYLGREAAFQFAW